MCDDAKPCCAEAPWSTAPAPRAGSPMCSCPTGASPRSARPSTPRGRECSTRAAPSSPRASSTATPTSIRRCSGIRGCDPMPQHGVTTVLIGNCSLGSGARAARPGRRGVDVVLLHRGHAADQRSRVASRGPGRRYPEYRDALGGRRPRRACSAAARALGPAHVRDGRPTPGSAAATADERREMSRAARRVDGRGRVRLLDVVSSTWTHGAVRCRADSPTTSNGRHWSRCSLATGGDWCSSSPTPEAERWRSRRALDGRDVRDVTVWRAPSTALVRRWRCARTTRRELMALARELRAGGASFWPQMSPRTIDFRINWETSMVFMMLAGVAPHPERRRRRRARPTPRAIPTWRARRERSGTRPTSAMFPSQHPHRVRFVEVTQPELRALVGSDAGGPGRGAGWSSVGRVRRLAARERPPAGCARRGCGQQQRRRRRGSCSSIPTR